MLGTMWLASVLRRDALFAMLAVLLGGCGGTQGTAATMQQTPIARRCEVTHSIRDADVVESNITRDGEGWTLALSLRVQLTADAPPIEIRGNGRVTGSAGHRACRVAAASSAPAQPQFDEALCLDEFESIADVLEDAETTARPGETVVQEVRLRSARRRRTRSRMARTANFSERAEITRDPQGRVIRIVRTTQQGGREQLQVSYPSGEDGHCLPME